MHFTIKNVYCVCESRNYLANRLILKLPQSLFLQILKKRKDLKVILMSATLNAEALSSYFDNCPMVHIEGLAFPVQDVYLEEIYK